MIFQFHKGTIKTCGRYRNEHNQADFNSIKVRLKHAVNAGSNAVRAFQFHKGTIKTCIILGIRLIPKFQFHKGTIKTVN